FTAPNFWAEFQGYYKTSIIEVARVASIKRLVLSKESTQDGVNAISDKPARFQSFFNLLLTITPTVQIYEQKYFSNNLNQFDALLTSLRTLEIQPTTEVVNSTLYIFVTAKEKTQK
ncbi:hypothetical protein PMAYCL1PPCAC_10013, partial [Pristionchus mayeri]